jgi:hypothetical protein
MATGDNLSTALVLDDDEVEEIFEGSTRAMWEGSNVTQADINWLLKSHRIPAEVICRLPGDEVEPSPQVGEAVVFIAHFQHGLGLPVSPFFWAFLNKFHLQPHHLPANAFTLLSSFATFTEGYLGLWPTVELWSRFHNFWVQSVPDPGNKGPKPMVDCGAATIIPRRKTDFFRVPGLESCRKWLRSFFYVRNSPDAKGDYINLPTYVSGPPIEKHN